MGRLQQRDNVLKSASPGSSHATLRAPTDPEARVQRVCDLPSQVSERTRTNLLRRVLRYGLIDFPLLSALTLWNRWSLGFPCDEHLDQAGARMIANTKAFAGVYKLKSARLCGEMAVMLPRQAKEIVLFVLAPSLAVPDRFTSSG